MKSWTRLIQRYSRQDVVVAVHLGYNRTSLDRALLDEEVRLLSALNFPKIELVEGSKAYLEGDNIDHFPHEDELKGHRFGTVYVCGSQENRCIPRLEETLKGFCERTVRLSKLIH
ncbi:hypothetical protein HYT57_04890 [Candidatus Woesearchaeota archaeon]|nr:hypothetical protein [Candidatus Woesearchaeota archaeon]